MGLFIRADAQLFTGAMQAMALLMHPRLSNVLQIIRACIGLMLATPGRSLWGISLLLIMEKRRCLRKKSTGVYWRFTKKEGYGAAGREAGSAMKYDHAPYMYMHCANLGWLV